MPRPEKVQAVAEIKDRLSDAEAVFVAEYAGLSVTEQQQLRRGLRQAGGEFKVVKMTLARLAASELGHEELLEMLTGPTGLAFASGDAAAAAKALRDFSKEHAALVIKGALLGAEVIQPERVSQLAELEPREVLLAKLAGGFQAPLAAMAGLLAAMPRAMATMVQQLIERAPAEVTAADEADEAASDGAEPAAPAEADASDGADDTADAESETGTAEPTEADEPDASDDGTDAESESDADEPDSDTEDPGDDDTADAAEEE